MTFLRLGMEFVSIRKVAGGLSIGVPFINGPNLGYLSYGDIDERLEPEATGDAGGSETIPSHLVAGQLGTRHLLRIWTYIRPHYGR